MQAPLIHRTRGASRGTTQFRASAPRCGYGSKPSDTLTLSRGSGGTPYWASGCSWGAMFPTVRRPAPTHPARSAARGSYSRSVIAGAIVAACPASCQTESGVVVRSTARRLWHPPRSGRWASVPAAGASSLPYVAVIAGEQDNRGMTSATKKDRLADKGGVPQVQARN